MPFPGPGTFPGAELFPGEGESALSFSELGDMLYDTLKPTWTDPDVGLGQPLRVYCDALMAQAQGIRDQVKEVGERPGYGVLMVPSDCPPDGLLFLSQFVGVDLSKLRQGFIVLERNEIVNPSFEHDAIGSTTPYGWSKESLSLAFTWEKFEVANGWSNKGSRALHVKTKHSGSASFGRLAISTPAGSYVPVTPGAQVAVQAELNVIHAPSNGFIVSISWYRADGTTLISNTGSPGEKLVGLTGEQLLTQLWEAPEHAAFAQVEIMGVSMVANEVAEFWIDSIITTVTQLPPEFPLRYVDGDQSECSWVGIPGESSSILTREETEEEFIEQQRNTIRELPSSGRGTAASIRKSAEKYLVGDKTVIMRERVGGNPWRLSIVTFIEETPNVALVRETIEETLPAGIVLEYEAVPSTTWSVIRGEYETWADVKAAFVTWNGVVDNKPGT